MRETKERWVYILKRRGHYMRNKEAALYKLKETFDVMFKIIDENPEHENMREDVQKQFEQYKKGELKIPDMYYAKKPRPQKPVFMSFEEMMIWERENKYRSY